ncbi:hypothetical protein ONZ51_g8267 [Trametes cubensis]|uniref:F-box domain-containing protein n=1 Tax=Trametes cubensis TaxID=1111947 RepID=A0AAD7TNJ1_9APHY|nr:hypothetical protein ONZ51_g8267 [Trametes cubensis]
MTLRRAANKFRPIHSLPPEILVHIFSMVPGCFIFDRGRQEDDHLGLPATMNMTDIRRLCPLLLTCSYWHSLIANTPSLWSTVLEVAGLGKRRPIAPAYYIRRCAQGTGPLRVCIPTCTPKTVKNLCLDPICAPRIQSLLYARSVRSLTDFKFISITLPNLEHCTLLSLCQTDSLGRPNPDSTLHSYPVFPASCRLRSLRLYGCDFIPTTGFPVLEELLVEFMNRPGLAWLLLAFLHKVPHLRRLELMNIGPRCMDRVSIPDDADHASYESVLLDRLEALVIRYPRRLSGLQLQHNSPWSSTPHGIGITFQQWALTHISTPSVCAKHLGALPFEHTFAGLANEIVAEDSTKHTYLTCSVDDSSSVDPSQKSLMLYAVVRPNPSAQIALFGGHVRVKGAGDCCSPTDMVPRRPALYVQVVCSPWFAATRRLRIGRNAGWLLLDPYLTLSLFPGIISFCIDDAFPEAPATCDVILMLHALRPYAGGTMACPELQVLSVDCTSRPSTQTEQALRECREVAQARAAHGHPVRLVLFTAWSLGSGGVAREDEYDEAGTLVETRYGKDALDSFQPMSEKAWEQITGY